MTMLSQFRVETFNKVLLLIVLAQSELEAAWCGMVCMCFELLNLLVLPR